ncbi:hypothetical protein [Burkholderia sp. Ac-20379]|nr:hypothetical protein [Burkholderia sp. Ac-20379]
MKHAPIESATAVFFAMRINGGGTRRDVPEIESVLKESMARDRRF